MRTIMRRWVVLIGAVVGGATLGCGAGHDPGSGLNKADVGTLTVALTAATAAGVTYHLSGAVFEVTNFAEGFDSLLSGDDPTLSVDLAPSVYPFDYQVNLQDGWTLNEVDPDGSEHPVGATLLTNFIPFTIKSQRTTPVVFQFQAGSVVVTFGNGTLSITLDVDDSSIDDFEDGDGLISPIGGRNGSWFTFNDGSGTQTPAPGGPVLPEVVTTDANYVLHETGKGFASQGTLPDGTFAYGAGLGANLLQDPTTGLPLPYDASGYQGIGFTFRYAFPSVNGSYQILGFAVATSATTPVAQGGTCADGCSDDFGFFGAIPYSPLYFTGGFAWADLRQQGFGTPTTFDPTTILSIKWIVSFPDFGQTSADNTFDFQLDNVIFLETPPLATDNKAASASASRSVWSGTTSR
jgi:hypothetical protein